MQDGAGTAGDGARRRGTVRDGGGRGGTVGDGAGRWATGRDGGGGITRLGSTEYEALTNGVTFVMELLP